MLGLRQKLSTIPLFAGLESSEIDGLFDLAETRTLTPGQELFVEGGFADALWIIMDGDVEISREGHVLAELGPGSALGELSLFTPNAARRSASARAICPVTVLRLPLATLRKLIDSHDHAMLKVVSNLARQMATRLLALNDRLLTDGRKGLSVARSELRRVVL